MSETCPPVSTPGPEGARAALDAVRLSQQGISDGMVVPRGYDELYSLSAGAMVGGIALFNAAHDDVVQVVIGVALCLGGLGTLGALMHWFRRVNGFWLSGVKPPRARYVAWMAGGQLGVFAFLASVAANAGHPVLALVAVAGTIACSYGLSRLWMVVYRAETQA